MKVEPFGYLLTLEQSLSAASSARYIAAKTAGSRPSWYSRWACKLEAQYQCTLSRNNVYATASTLLLIMRYRNTLRRRGLRHRVAYIAHFRVIPLTQFLILARKSPFSHSGSHKCSYICNADCMSSSNHKTFFQVFKWLNVLLTWKYKHHLKKSRMPLLQSPSLQAK